MKIYKLQQEIKKDPLQFSIILAVAIVVIALVLQIFSCGSRNRTVNGTPDTTVRVIWSDNLIKTVQFGALLIGVLVAWHRAGTAARNSRTAMRNAETALKTAISNEISSLYGVFSESSKTLSKFNEHGGREMALGTILTLWSITKNQPEKASISLTIILTFIRENSKISDCFPSHHKVSDYPALIVDDKLELQELSSLALEEAFNILGAAYATVDEYALERCVLTDAAFVGLHLKKCYFVDADFSGTIFVSFQIDSTSFERCIFYGSLLKDLNSSETSFRGCIFQEAIWHKVSVKRQSLAGSNFSSSRIVDVEFLNCNFWENRCEYWMAGSNFSNAHLKDVSFRGSDLRFANFSGATLNNVDFRDARLSFANFDGAIFEEVELQGVDLHLSKNISKRQISQAVCDGKTEFPSSLV